MPIKKMTYLPLTRHLKALKLHAVKLEKWNGPGEWKVEDTEEMVSVFSNMQELETLELYSVPIKDVHLERLLSNLKSLRVLEISGTFGEANLSQANIGQITDRGCETNCSPTAQPLKPHS